MRKIDELMIMFIVNRISGTSLIMACCNDCVESVQYERCAQFDDDCRDLVRGISQGCPTVFSQRIMKIHMGNYRSYVAWSSERVFRYMNLQNLELQMCCPIWNLLIKYP